jgi:hypothetical protein
MTKTWTLTGMILALGALAAAAAPAPSGSPGGANVQVAATEYMRAVPARPRGIHCHKICVKFGRGTPTHPPICLQWRMVC